MRRMVLKGWRAVGVAVMALGWVSCSDGREEATKALLGRSREALEGGDYAQALSLADSARLVGATDTDAQRAVIELKRQISLREAEAKMVSLQEALEAFAPRLEQALDEQEMQLSKLSDYDDSPMYRSRWELSNLKAKGLHVAVDSLGGLRLETTISSPKALEHTAFRLSGWRASDGSMRTFDSSNVAYDGALNYRYQVDGIHWEQIRYPSDDGVRLSRLVNELGGLGTSTLKLDLLRAGQPIYSASLSREERQSLGQGLRLSALLRERASMLREQEKYTRRYLRLQEEEAQRNR